MLIQLPPTALGQILTGFQHNWPFLLVSSLVITWAGTSFGKLAGSLTIARRRVTAIVVARSGSGR